ncbi:N-acetyltransferase [Microbacterium esteraromaticum]|uniref:N-acetyltransferase n=1 Tax=Microbacterium esteraromaticum TaxID=57043 RepID=A0A7D7WIJ7_9MICO|nr:N-acetyltransferase [Microbacterium esteraromaticum]QMU97270.1 N-acetyltransferase [Microbacterium esteraromaticum]
MSSTARAFDFVFLDEKDASRYTLTRGGELLSVLDYRDDGSTVAMTRAYTIPIHRGRGYAAKVVAGAVADLEARGDRSVDPVCWYVADWFDAHPDKRHMLRPR